MEATWPSTINLTACSTAVHRSGLSVSTPVLVTGGCFLAAEPAMPRRALCTAASRMGGKPRGVVDSSTHRTWHTGTGGRSVSLQDTLLAGNATFCPALRMRCRATASTPASLSPSPSSSSSLAPAPASPPPPLLQVRLHMLGGAAMVLFAARTCIAACRTGDAEAHGPKVVEHCCGVVAALSLRCPENAETLVDNGTCTAHALIETGRCSRSVCP